MKRVFAAISILLVSAAFTPVSAQEQEAAPVIKDSSGFQLAIAPSFQNPDTKEVVYKLVIYSKIRTDRLFVSWKVTGSSELSSESKLSGSITLSVVPEQTYIVPVVLKPRTQGLSNLFFTVEAFEANGTYVATASQNIFSDRSGSIVPAASQVTILQIVLLIRGIAENVLKLVALIFAVLLAYRLFRYWLGPKEGTPAPNITNLLQPQVP